MPDPHSTNFRLEYSFLLFSKAFIGLYVFIYLQCNDFFFFYVFDGFLEDTEIFILARVSNTDHSPLRAFFSTILAEKKTFPRCLSLR